MINTQHLYNPEVFGVAPAPGLPSNIELFRADEPLPETTRSLVEDYNAAFYRGGETAIYSRLPDVQKAPNGLSFTAFGEPSEVLVVKHNEFATDLSPRNRLRGQFLYDAMAAAGIVGPDGLTPQVVQIASASRAISLPLKLFEHLQIASGNLAPVADRVAEVLFSKFPVSQKVLSVGYSLSGFLTPDILKSAARDRDVVAAFIANPPGCEPERMKTTLSNFSHAGEHMKEHVDQSQLAILRSPAYVSAMEMVREKAKVVADVVWRPANLSLWRAFGQGKLFDRINDFHQTVPNAQIGVAYGYEDQLCHPEAIERFLQNTDYKGVLVEHGDHSWGANLPRSLGHLVLNQIKNVLAPGQNPTPALLAA